MFKFQTDDIKSPLKNIQEFIILSILIDTLDYKMPICPLFLKKTPLIDLKS